MLYRLHPHLAQDLRCRMTTSRITTMLADDINIASRAIDDSLKEALDIATALERNKSEQKSIALTGSDKTQMDLLTVDLDILAEQLTIVDQLYLKAISVSDLLQSAWVKRFNGLSMWVAHSNSLSQWVASRILQTTKRARRAEIINRFIKLIHLLWGMKNFASATTIYLALSLQSISRLKKTWAFGALGLEAQFGRLNEMIKPLNNFVGYRDELQSVEAPGIPYMAVLTKDLVTLEEIIDRVDEGTLTEQSCSLEETGKLVNLNNMQTIVRVVQSQFRRFKQAQYQITPDPKLFPELFFPDAFGLVDETELYNKSLEVEPATHRPTTSTEQPTSPTTPSDAIRRAASTTNADVRRSSSIMNSPGRRSSGQHTRKRTSLQYSEKRVSLSLTESELESSSSESVFLDSMELPTIESVAEEHEIPEFIVPWRRHSTLIAASLDAACASLRASKELVPAHRAAQVSRFIRASLQDQPEPPLDKLPKNMRGMSDERPEKSNFVSIGDFLNDQASINAALDDLNCNFVIEEDVNEEDLSRHSLSRLQAVQLHTVTTELNFAVSRSLCGSDARPIICARLSSISKSPSSSQHFLILKTTFQTNKVRKDPTTIETETLSMLSPTTSLRMSELHSRLVIVGTGNHSVQVTFTMIVPTQLVGWNFKMGANEK